MKHLMYITGGGGNRAKKILWFMLSYNMAIANKLGKEFFRLLKNFPPWNNFIQNI